MSSSYCRAVYLPMASTGHLAAVERWGYDDIEGASEPERCLAMTFMDEVADPLAKARLCSTHVHASTRRSPCCMRKEVVEAEAETDKFLGVLVPDMTSAMCG